MADHQIVIPGLDNQLCGVCRKWVPRQWVIERLKQQLTGANNKRYAELNLQLNQAIELAKRCPGKP